MIAQKHLTGIGELEFAGASQIILNDEFAGLTLMYTAIHGGEDKKKLLNPIENDQFNKEFNEVYN